MLRVAVMLALVISALQAQVAAVHGGGVDESLDANRVRDIFLGRVTTWSDGSPVVLVIADDAESDALLARLVGRDRERLLRGWKRLVYSGAGAMPLQASNQRAALELVASHPGSIVLLPEVGEDSRWRRVPVRDR